MSQAQALRVLSILLFLDKMGNEVTYKFFRSKIRFFINSKQTHIEENERLPMSEPINNIGCLNGEYLHHLNFSRIHI